MRIAYVCADPGVPVFGQKGCSIHVQELIRALQQQGAQVELFATRLGGEVPADLANGVVHALPPLPKGDPATREQAALAANQTLRQRLEAAGSFDLVYERYSLWSVGGMDYGRDRGIPTLLEVNAPLIDEQATHRQLIHRSEAEHIARHLFQTATAVIAVSTPIKDYVHQVAMPRAVYVIPNGVNPERFSLGLSAARPPVPDTFTVGFVGTLKPWHGLSVLVEAFERLQATLPQARLLIVGDGPERKSLMAHLSQRQLLDVTHLTGAIAPEAVPGWLASMTVAVAPYPAQSPAYFSPLKVYEYMAAGLPVVASRVGQLDGLIRHGVTGLLCTPGDAAELATALEHLWRSPRLRTQLGQAARQQVLQHHTWGAIAHQILAIAQDSVLRWPMEVR